MLVRLTIDLTVAVHFTFVLFVIFGGVLACKWRWVRWLHLPALVYGLLIEIFNWYCPLTLKGLLQLRSVYHRRDERVRAHVFVAALEAVAAYKELNELWRGWPWRR